jgi:hypothetical protein
MKTYASSSSSIHSDEWRLVYLLIVWLTAPILLAMMMQPRALPHTATDDLLKQPVRTPYIAGPRQAEEDEEMAELERSIVINMERIYSEVHPLCSNHPLTAINSQPLPGVLSFSQARNLEQAMVSDNPSNDQVQPDKEFSLRDVGREARYGLFKWCNVFGILTVARNHGNKGFVPSTPKYVEAVRSAFTVETQDSGAGGPALSDSKGPALFGRRGFVTRSIGYCHRIIQSIMPLLEKIKKLLLRVACLR